MSAGTLLVMFIIVSLFLEHHLPLDPCRRNERKKRGKERKGWRKKEGLFRVYICTYMYI